MDTTTLITDQVSIGLVLVFLQNWLKQQKWFPFITQESKNANHLFSIMLTGLATLGIHFTYSSTDHTLVISGLVWSTIAKGIWHWLQQYAITKGLYVGLQKPTVQVQATEEPLDLSVEKSTPKATTSPYDIK